MSAINDYIRECMLDKNRGALDVHPDRRTRKQHLQVISYFAKTQDATRAMEYWLDYCPRISRKAFNEAINA